MANLDQLPPVLKPLIFGLAPSDVTDPLPIPNGIAIFQLRARLKKQIINAPQSGPLIISHIHFLLKVQAP